MDCSTARLPCPSPSPGACSNSYPLSRWCRPATSSSVSPSPPAPNLSQHQGLFQWAGSLHQVAKVLELSFSISPSNEYWGLISFMIDWCDRLVIQGDQSLSLSCTPSLNHKRSYMFLSTVLKSHLSLFHKVILMISSIILLWSALKYFFWGEVNKTDSELVENLFKDSKCQS